MKKFIVIDDGEFDYAIVYDAKTGKQLYWDTCRGVNHWIAQQAADWYNIDGKMIEGAEDYWKTWADVPKEFK